jgi:hypothetical protein
MGASKSRKNAQPHRWRQTDSSGAEPDGSAQSDMVIATDRRDKQEIDEGDGP